MTDKQQLQKKIVDSSEKLSQLLRKTNDLDQLYEDIEGLKIKEFELLDEEQQIFRGTEYASIIDQTIAEIEVETQYAQKKIKQLIADTEEDYYREKKAYSQLEDDLHFVKNGGTLK
ncbi:hypothetical protein ACWOFR_04750 [Carnobacterium gallinarum]|uniref:hypothetical protein n=1 Tax=Carnobacterium gallinarum TaxID=2749 RepID=UPI000556160F|nr:hypothetical protein [Carnobacterium gallinarum]